jgi:hypothetical protein
MGGLATGACFNELLLGGAAIGMLGFFGAGADGIILGVDATGPFMPR